MKNKLFLAGLLSLLLAAGLVLTGCKQEADDDDGGGSATLKVVNNHTQWVVTRIDIKDTADLNSCKTLWSSMNVKYVSILPDGGTDTFTGLPVGSGYIYVEVGSTHNQTLPGITGEAGKTTTVTISGNSEDGANFGIDVSQPQ
jgi:hypothetical protein